MQIHRFFLSYPGKNDTGCPVFMNSLVRIIHKAIKMPGLHSPDTPGLRALSAMGENNICHGFNRSGA
jgi:hypothetical protein